MSRHELDTSRRWQENEIGSDRPVDCQQALRHTPRAVRCGGKASLLRSSLVIIASTLA